MKLKGWTAAAGLVLLASAPSHAAFTGREVASLFPALSAEDSDRPAARGFSRFAQSTPPSCS